MSLAHIKVLDFTHLLPGEIASTLLSDMGAEVLRIERQEPTLNERLPPIVDGESLYFWSLHRNKRRIKIDLKTDAGISAVYKLVESADVVIENFRPAVMERLGLGADTLQKINDKLVYCSISGYGSQSKWSARPGHDLNFVAETGILYETQDQNGAPIMPAVFVSDYMSGTYASLAIVAALLEREQSGKGKKLEISMFESALSALGVKGTMSLYLNLDPSEIHTKYPDALPNHRVYLCQDGRYLAVAPVETEFWIKFLTLINRTDLLKKDLLKDRHFITDEIAAVIQTKTMADWVAHFQDANCCVSPVNKVSEAVNFLPEGQCHIVTHMEHSRLGPVPQLTNPIRRNQDQASGNDQSCSDTVAETELVLKSIGLSDEQILAMKACGIIGR